MPWVFERRVAVIITTGFVVSVLVQLMLWPTATPFQLLANDAFYYLAVARNVYEHGLVSLDQEHLSNGFHPLWQLLTCTWYAASRSLELSIHAQIIIDIILGTGLAGFGLWATVRCAARAGDRPSLLALLPLGVTSLVLLAGMELWWGHHRFAHPVTSVWATVNGMESSLVIALFGASALLFCRLVNTGRLQSARSGAVLGLTLAMLTLSRLDHVFFAAALLCSAASGIPRPWTRERWAFLGAASAVLGSVLVTYMLVNWVVFGAAMPLSGSVKSTFPVPHTGNLLLARQIVTGVALPVTHVLRGVQMFVPAALALVFLLVTAASSRSPRPAYERFLRSAAVGTIALAVYNTFFVMKMDQGFWYYPASNLAASCFVVHLLSAATRRYRRARAPWLRYAGVASVSLVVAGYSSVAHERGGTGRAHFVLEEGPRVQAALGKRPRIISFDDGVVAFATGLPALSGMGLVLDADAVRRLQQGAGKTGKKERVTPQAVLGLGLERGYRHFASLSYTSRRLSKKSSTRDIERAYRPLLDLRKLRKDYRLRVVYASRKNKFSIIEVVPVRRG